LPPTDAALSTIAPNGSTEMLPDQSITATAVRFAKTHPDHAVAVVLRGRTEPGERAAICVQPSGGTVLGGPSPVRPALPSAGYG
jgi:hypothetical protein